MPAPADTETVDGAAAEAAASRAWGGYDPEQQRPLRAYVGMTAAYAAAAGTATAATAARSGPRRPSIVESLRLGVATHKLARLIAKDKVTSPYRAPFMRFESTEDAGPGEVSERPRGTGLRYAIGELLSCPYCLAPWLATALVVARRLAPGPTATVIAILESVTVADFLQIAYKGSESKLL